MTGGGGPLNPQFVEWLMGLPSDWTALKPWVATWLTEERLKKSHMKRLLKSSEQKGSLLAETESSHYRPEPDLKS